MATAANARPTQRKVLGNLSDQKPATNQRPVSPVTNDKYTQYDQQ